MPRFLKAEDISMKYRRPHLNRYKRQLREALLDPGLSDAKRVEIKGKLASIGQPKTSRTTRTLTQVPTPLESVGDPVLDSSDVTYSSLPDTPTLVVQAEPELVSESGETLNDLLELGKDELLSKAADEGAKAFKSWNMTRIAKAILNHRAASK